MKIICRNIAGIAGKDIMFDSNSVIIYLDTYTANNFQYGLFTDRRGIFYAGKEDKVRKMFDEIIMAEKRNLEFYEIDNKI